MAKSMSPTIAWLLLVCLMLAPPAVLASDPNTLTVGKAQDGRDLDLKVGSILEIEFPGEAVPATAGRRRPPGLLTSSSCPKPPDRLRRGCRGGR